MKNPRKEWLVVRSLDGRISVITGTSGDTLSRQAGLGLGRPGTEGGE
jgi:hypothetical protein